MSVKSQFLSHPVSRSILFSLLVLLLASFRIAFAADGSSSSASQYFGHIETPCANDTQCKEFTDLVIRASNGDECNQIDRECGVGEAILRRIFGSTYREALPDFIVYLDDTKADGKKDGIIELKKHPPLLMWQGENTPHLLGVRAIYVVALAHHQLDLHATVTSDSQYEPNPLLGLLGSFKAPEVKGTEVKPTESKDGVFVWRRLDGEEENHGYDDKAVMWLGTAHITVPENTINRITVSYGPLPTEDAAGTSKDATGSNKATAEKNKSNTDEKTDREKEKYSGDFLAATGHFTNSPEANTAVSFALGTTFNSKNTSIASGGSNVNIDGLVFAKFYISRPYLYATPRMTRYSPSFGIVIGTNVNGTIFNDIVVGVSVGHLVGNVGVIVGANSIAGIANTSQGRKNRAFLGMEYTF